VIEYAHGFRMHDQTCDGCLACMRVCPTYAIRVKHGTAHVLSGLWGTGVLDLASVVGG